jgi:hypothetical protein
MKRTFEINEHFDKIFVINMDHEIEKKKIITDRLNKLDINFEFISAINGHSDEFSKEWSYYNTRPKATYWEEAYNKKFIESRGAWGYLKTMIYILSIAIQKGHKRILIFDNDCLFDQNFQTKYLNFYKIVNDSDWKILLLGASDYGLSDETTAPYYFPGKLSTCGSFAIGIDQSVYYEILEEALRMETNFDNLPVGNIYEKYKNQCFVAYPNIVIADVRTSTIRSGRDMVSHSQTMKWELDNFILD